MSNTIEAVKLAYKLARNFTLYIGDNLKLSQGMFYMKNKIRIFICVEQVFITIIPNTVFFSSKWGKHSNVFNLLKIKNMYSKVFTDDPVITTLLPEVQTKPACWTL